MPLWQITLRGNVQGFFTNDVLLRRSGGEGRLEVRSTGSRDGDDIQFRIGEEFPEIGISFATVFGDKFIDCLTASTEERMELAAFHSVFRPR